MDERVPWNARKKVGIRRPLTQKQILAVRFFLDREGRLRDRALFDLAIDSKLRGCDLVEIRIGDLVAGSEMRRRATAVQQKTHRSVQFELTGDIDSSEEEVQSATIHSQAHRPRWSFQYTAVCASRR